MLRRRDEPAADAFDRRWTRDELAARFGADPADVGIVTEAVTALGAAVIAVDPAARLVRIRASVAVANELFGVTVRQAAAPSGGSDEAARHPDRDVSLPGHVAARVTAVLGLDTRPQLRPRLRTVPPGAAGAAQRASFTPPELAQIYRMPRDTDGTGQTIAILELGGGFSAADMHSYFGGLGLPVPDIRTHGVDGARNAPTGTPDGPDGEVALDIEVAGAIAPAATLEVYFAPNTDAGFLDALVAAGRATSTPTAISISWGSSEDSWSPSSRRALDEALADASLLGSTITVAAGDSGSSDATNATTTGGTPAAGAGAAVHVDFPASSPHALACGGTTLRADAATGVVASETVWNDMPAGGATGGGVSDVFPQPEWQARAGVPPRVGGVADAASRRGVPDVAAVADPRTGFRVLIDGRRTVLGGTSAVAPLWAALIARLAQSRGQSFGLLQPTLYAGISPGAAVLGFTDVTSGDNGAYRAAPGWDPCTGLGSPLGDELASRILADPR